MLVVFVLRTFLPIMPDDIRHTHTHTHTGRDLSPGYMPKLCSSCGTSGDGGKFCTTCGGKYTEGPSTSDQKVAAGQRAAVAGGTAVADLSRTCDFCGQVPANTRMTACGKVYCVAHFK